MKKYKEKDIKAIDEDISNHFDRQGKYETIGMQSANISLHKTISVKEYCTKKNTNKAIQNRKAITLEAERSGP